MRVMLLLEWIWMEFWSVLCKFNGIVESVLCKFNGMIKSILCKFNRMVENFR